MYKDYFNNFLLLEECKDKNPLEIEYVKIREHEWESVRCYKNVCGLDISSNRTEKLPDWLPELELVKHLRVDGISEEDISVLENMPSLEKLWITRGPFPKELKKLKHLKCLQIDMWGIIEKYMEPEYIQVLVELPNLEELIFYDCYVTDEIGKLVNLKRLTLANQRFSVTKEGLKKLSKLEELRLSGINLSVPEEFELTAKYLKILQLTHCKLNDLPPCIYEMSQLEYLILANNQITNVSKKLSHLLKLKGLDLSGNQLMQYPVGLFELSELEQLYLVHNKLGNPPAELFETKQLKILNLEDTAMDSLPDCITKMKSLKTLVLNHNKLEKSLLGLDMLEHLECLEVKNCNISTFPLEILTLDGLVRLNISYNPLLELPDKIDCLKQLEYFNFDGCGITMLPDTIRSLDRLKEVHFDENPLSGKEKRKITELLADENIANETNVTNESNPLIEQINTLTNLIREEKLQGKEEANYALVRLSDDSDTGAEPVATGTTIIEVIQKTASIFTGFAQDAGEYVDEDPAIDLPEEALEFDNYQILYLL